MLNFYAGFEGEPEIQVILGNPVHPIKMIRMWAGHFDSLMSAIEPESGRWTGLALPYHLHEGWYGGSPWRVPNLREVLQQWQSIETQIPVDCRPQYLAVLALMHEALNASTELWISEE